MDTGLVVLRVVVGLILVGHGGRKLFGWFGGGGLAATAWFFGSVGFWPPRLMAGLTGGAELVGGAALGVGLGTTLAAAVVIAAMLNVAVVVHQRNGRLVIEGGYGYPLGTTMVAITLAFTGPGVVSLDATLGLGDVSVEWEMLAFALGLIAGLGALFGRAAVRSGARPASKLSPNQKVAP